MPYQNIVYTKENHIATARFNRPEVLNALDVETHIELHEAIRDAQMDNDVRVMVITGTGRAFAAGRDLRERARRMKGEAPPPDITRPSSSPWDIGLAIWNMPKPVIAAVNGIVVGGGMSIVLASDIILASENASFGEAFVKTGRVASGFTNFLLPRMIGPHKAKQLLFTGDLVPAKEAERIGLINEVYPAAEFEAKVRQFAEKIASLPVGSIRIMKRLVNDGLSMNIESVGRAETFSLEVLRSAHAGDLNEGTQAFLEKRKADYK